MAEPSETITTVSGRRCTRTIRTDAPSTTLLISSSVLSSDAVPTSINVAPPESLPPSDPISSLSSTPPAPPPQDTSSETEIESILSPPPSPSRQPPEEPQPPTETPSDPSGGSTVVTDDDEPTPVPIPTTIANPPPNPEVPSSPLIPGTIETPVVVNSQSALPIVQPFVAAAAVPSPQPALSTAIVPNRLGDTPKNGGPSPVPDSDSVSSDLSSSLPVPFSSSTSISNPRTTVITSTSSTISPSFPSDGPSTEVPIGSGTDGSSGPSMAPIAGGVVGGLFGIALIAGLFFLCFKRRKNGNRTLPWQRERIEKSHASDGDSEESSLMRRMRDRTWMLFALFGGKPSERESSPDSIRSNRRSSTWSDVPNSPTLLARSRSMSAPAESFRRGGLPGFVAGFKTRHGSRKNSPPTGHPSPESETSRYSIDDNPFIDPPGPAHLQVRNPDFPAPLAINRNTNSQGPANKQRGPVSGLIRTTTISRPLPPRDPKDPFADQSHALTPEYFRKSHHSRSQSLHTALHSHPPASDPPACPINSNPNPFADPAPQPSATTTPPTKSSNITPPTAFTSATPPKQHTRMPSSARSSYSGLIFQSNNTATPSARSSANVAGTPFINTARNARGKSDPFDLEGVVGSMGSVPRKEVKMSPGDKRRSNSATRWGSRVGAAK